MTRVTLDDSDGVFRIVIEGHATGSTEVCAAVSCLAYTAAEYLDRHDDRKEVVDLTDGHGELVFRDKALYDIISTGLEMLADNFPEYIFCQIGGYGSDV